MRPIGFESRAKRFQRSLLVGAVAGFGVVITSATLLAFARHSASGHVGLTVLASGLGLGFFTGFGLAFLWPDFAPPRRDDGDAEAGVTARLVPPLPSLNAKIAPAPQPENAYRNG